jgi:hypothetical protein
VTDSDLLHKMADKLRKRAAYLRKCFAENPASTGCLADEVDRLAKEIEEAGPVLEPAATSVGTCRAFAHKHALHTKTNFCDGWEESTFLARQ